MKEKCLFCGKNLRDGIIINGKRICPNCEGRLIATNMNTDFYEHYKNILKKNIVPILVAIQY